MLKLFVGERYLVGAESISAEASKIVGEELAKSSQTFLPEDVEGSAYGRGPAGANGTLPEAIAERFRSFSPLAVAGAGLVDGVNPCAFTTIIFLLSVLTLLGKTRKEMFAVGVGFTLAVFLAYLLLGLGVFKAIKAFSVNHRIHICKNQASKGIPLFSGVSDRVRFNTFLPFASGAWGRTVSDSSVPLSWGDIVKCACEPRPFDAVVAIENSDESPQRQRLVLARGLLDSLAAGAKGLYLRGGSRSVAGGLLDSVEGVKGLLRISEPIDLRIASSDEDVSCRAHLVGDEGLLLFVVRRELRDPTAVLRDVVLTLEDEAEVDVKRAARVDDGRFRPCKLQEKDGRIEINIGRLDIGTIVVLGGEDPLGGAPSEGLE